MAKRAASSTADSFALGLVLIALLGVTAISLRRGPIWQPGAPTRAPWCLPGQMPEFQFGFAELAGELGDIVGQPTECEHGDAWTSDTRQETTTGVAVYRWCSNTPGFTRGQEHWMLTSKGLEYWTDAGPPPPPQPVLRAGDLRQPCDP
jgi:hypothetical protein